MGAVASAHTLRIIVTRARRAGRRRRSSHRGLFLQPWGAVMPAGKSFRRRQVDSEEEEEDELVTDEVR